MSEPSQDTLFWLQRHQDGEGLAQYEFWNRVYRRLARRVARKLTQCGVQDPGCDEEDVALSALKSFLSVVDHGRVLNDRDELWKLLYTIANRKVFAMARKTGAKKRGGTGARNQGEAAGQDEGGAARIRTFSLDTADSPGGSAEPSPEMEVLFADLLEHALGQLEPLECVVAMEKMGGATHEEIAEKIGKSVTTVGRIVKRLEPKIRDHVYPEIG